MYGSRAVRRWSGSPQFAFRVPDKAQAAALRRAAIARGVPYADILRELLNQWYHSGNGVEYHTAPVPPPLPQIAQRRADTGKSAPSADLQRIDADRIEATDKGPGFSD